MKIRSVLSLAVTALAVTWANNASALQLLDAVPGQTLYAKISMREMTRLSLESGRIKTIPNIGGELIIEADKDNGQVFIKPAADTTKPINVFLTDEAGVTYGLVLQPLDMPMESVIIRNKAAASQQARQAQNRSEPYLQQLKNLLLAMYNPVWANGMEVRDKEQEIGLWKEVRFVLKQTFADGNLVGEKYEMTNISEKPLRLAEQELLRKNVELVSFESLNLAPGDTTRVMIIRERDDNE